MDKLFSLWFLTYALFKLRYMSTKGRYRETFIYTQTTGEEELTLSYAKVCCCAEWMHTSSICFILCINDGYNDDTSLLATYFKTVLKFFSFLLEQSRVQTQRLCLYAFLSRLHKQAFITNK